MAVFSFQWQSWVAAPETVWSPKLKIFTIWPSAEGFLTLTLNKSRSHHPYCQLLLPLEERQKPHGLRRLWTMKCFQVKCGLTFLGTECFCLLKWVCRRSNPSFDGIWRRDRWEGMSFRQDHKDGAPTVGLMSFWEKETRISRLQHVKKKEASVSWEEGPHQ